MGFQEDLKEGKQIEEKFAELLRVRNNTNVWVTKGKTKYDIVYINKLDEIKTVEVKYDRMSEETDNVAIEVSCSDEPTGIARAACDYVVYYMRGDFYICEGVILSYLLKDYETIKGGDGNRAEIVLMKQEEFKTIFNKV